jgi:excinuclease ABC subunit B
VIEQIIRPTGLVDPRIEVRRADFQVDDLIGEIRKQVKEGHRVLVTTLTKRMAEDLTEYLAELNIRVRYMHSDINTIERIETVRDLRLGNFDVLVGINLLREGLDIPEVSLVAVLDADNEGFLRSERSLIQTAGRAARNVMGTVILYANNMTDSMRRAIQETDRRRKKQLEYNAANKIVPRSVQKEVADILAEYRLKPDESEFFYEPQADFDQPDGVVSPDERIQAIEKEMKEAASRLEFERAAFLRDEIKKLREKRLLLQ